VVGAVTGGVTGGVGVGLEDFDDILVTDRHAVIVVAQRTAGNRGRLVGAGNTRAARLVLSVSMRAGTISSDTPGSGSRRDPRVTRDRYGDPATTIWCP
jgi:hypothetical protein